MATTPIHRDGAAKLAHAGSCLRRLGNTNMATMSATNPKPAESEWRVPIVVFWGAVLVCGKHPIAECGEKPERPDQDRTDDRAVTVGDTKVKTNG